MGKTVSYNFAVAKFRDAHDVHSFFLNLGDFMHIWNLGSYDSRQEKEGGHVTCLLWKRISWNAEVIDAA